ncbi:hypothetical protein [Pseudomonas abietaniphila]|nr:hypothetical protein [Pseudomonas abietaniphila]
MTSVRSLSGRKRLKGAWQSDLEAIEDVLSSRLMTVGAIKGRG